MNNKRNQTLEIIEKGLEKWIPVDENRVKISYILKALEDRRLTKEVEIMTFNHILKLLSIPDPENRVLKIIMLFQSVLIDMYSPESRKHHLETLESLN
jgi:hypothetical protein